MFNVFRSNQRSCNRGVYISLVLVFFGVCALFFSNLKSSYALTVIPKVEIDADPGQTVSMNLKVTNEEKQTRTFYLRSQNFNSQDETGTPSFTTRVEDLASWIKAPLSITLGPGETINLPVQIEVPTQTEPGGHYAAVFYLNQPPTVDGDQSAVALGSKLGTLVLLRVKGNFVSNANILEFGTQNKQRFFSQLPIEFYYRFQNTGADHLRPFGDVQVTNILGSTSKILVANPSEGSVLPKSIRRFTTAWTEYGGVKQVGITDIPKADKMSYWDAVNFQARHFVIGRYKANLKLGFGVKELRSDHAEFVFYVIPWQLLSVAIPLLIIVLFILRSLIRRYNRFIIKRSQRI